MNGFYLFAVSEVISFQISISQIHYIQNIITLRSSTQRVEYIITVTFTLIEKGIGEKKFFKYMLLHIRKINKKPKKKIPCHINKVTTCIYVTPPAVLFIGFCKKQHNCVNSIKHRL